MNQTDKPTGEDLRTDAEREYDRRNDEAVWAGLSLIAITIISVILAMIFL